MRIDGLPVDTQTKCLNCMKQATWTFGISECYWSLCNSCCDELSSLAGEGDQYLDKISMLVD